MAKADAATVEKRIRQVHEWLIEDWRSVDIIQYGRQIWDIDERQIKRYISDARKIFDEEEKVNLSEMRKRKVIKLQKLARSLDKSHKGTPAGIRAMLEVEKTIIGLQGLNPVKKLEVSGKDGKPIVTESVATVLVLPSNGRELKHAAGK